MKTLVSGTITKNRQAKNKNKSQEHRTKTKTKYYLAKNNTEITSRKIADLR